VLRLRPGIVVSATVLALGVTLAAPAGAAPAEDDAVFTSYVALGDSYAAGPLIPVQSGRPAGCLRSNRNYPSLVADRGGVSDFTDASCSGATTEDLFASQDTGLGANPPQLDALTDATEGVTLTVGGNDIGFGEIVQECARRSPTRPSGAACRDFYTADGEDELAGRIERTAPKVAAALAAIAQRSPDARVLLVGYPAILPDEGPGCFPVVPFSPGDVEYLRTTQKALNAMLEEQADAADVDFVDTYDRFLGHDVCRAPGVRWVEGLVPTAPAAPVHPNALGMAEMAAVVLGELADVPVLSAGA
jgi:lysophospholipase L1-like esterase